jgi:hypothetical protein
VERIQTSSAEAVIHTLSTERTINLTELSTARKETKMLNASTTMGTAVLRGFYNFIGTGATGAITCYLAMQSVVGDQVSNGDVRTVSILTGILAGLAALGFRGGVEGIADSKRQAEGDVTPADVQPNVIVTTP